MIETTRDPNIVLLTVDACRADHLSCYGYSRETSPRIDAFAERGVRFSNAFSVSTHTREAVHGLLSGRYPDASSAGDYSLHADSLATQLAEAGYLSAAFHSNPFLSEGYGFDRDFDFFFDDTAFGRHKYFALLKRLLDKLRNDHYVRAAELNERSKTWISSLPDNQSFFLWNHYMDVHGPFEPHGPQHHYVDRDVTVEQAQDLYRRATGDPDAVTEADEELLVDLYDDEVRYVDQRIGRFLAFLESAGELEHSIVILTADHGELFGHDGLYAHPRRLKEALLRVPMVVLDGRPGSKRAIEPPVSTLDVVPTVLRSLGMETGSLPGTPLWNIATNPSDHADRTVFTQVRSEDNERRRFGAHSPTGFGSLEWSLSNETFRWLREPPTDQLKTELKAHAKERMSDSTNLDTEQRQLPQDVEQRLELLGYK
jgi:arylsulfatase